MATIGRKAAVAEIVVAVQGALVGFMAWLAWLMVHIYFLIGFRNRLGVSPVGVDLPDAARTARG